MTTTAIIRKVTTKEVRSHSHGHNNDNTAITTTIRTSSEIRKGLLHIYIYMYIHTYISKLSCSIPACTHAYAKSGARLLEHPALKLKNLRLGMPSRSPEQSSCFVSLMTKLHLDSNPKGPKYLTIGYLWFLHSER